MIQTLNKHYSLSRKILRFLSDLPAKKDAEQVQIEKQQKLKQLLDFQMKPPRYEDSVQKYNDHLNNVSAHSEFKKIFYLKKLQEVRNTIAYNEKQMLRFHYSSFLIFLSILTGWVIYFYTERNTKIYEGKFIKVVFQTWIIRGIFLWTFLLPKALWSDLMVKETLEQDISQAKKSANFRTYYMETLLNVLRPDFEFSEKMSKNLKNIYEQSASELSILFLAVLQKLVKLQSKQNVLSQNFMSEYFNRTASTDAVQKMNPELGIYLKKCKIETILEPNWSDPRDFLEGYNPCINFFKEKIFDTNK